MIIESAEYTLTIIQEPYYAVGSSDNLNSYSNEYDLGDGYKPVAIYGLRSETGSSCVLLAAGGATSVSEQSVVIKNTTVWVGIADTLVCLSLPSLEKQWHVKIDDATCFGVFFSPDGQGLLIHGELLITKITFAGDVLWTSGGKDIFTEGFAIYDSYIEAVDFNHEKYRISIDNGASELV